MTETRRAGRHSAAAAPSATPPPDVEAEDVWVPPPFEPARPGDFVEYSSAGFEVRRSRRGLVLLLLVLLLAAAGGSWWYVRHQSSSPPQALTCADVYAELPAPMQHYLDVTEGGTLPAGIPVPLGQPGQRCTASNNTGSGLIVVWPGASESEYSTLLAAGGWASASTTIGYTLYVNGGDPREVATTVIDGQLVAMYDH